jgi:hypothetical protein
VEPIETIEYKEHTIEIHYDLDPEDPREWENLATMFCLHHRYNLGDKHSHETVETWLEELACPGIEADELEDLTEEQLWELIDKHYMWLPLYLYDHSGITISTSHQYPYNDRWDAGQVGYIYVSKEKALKEYNKKRWSKKFEAVIVHALETEVEVYDNYLCNEVYGYILKDQNDKEVDSCWGYYGDTGKKQMIQECKEAIDRRERN